MQVKRSRENSRQIQVENALLRAMQAAVSISALFFKQVSYPFSYPLIFAGAYTLPWWCKDRIASSISGLGGKVSREESKRWGTHSFVTLRKSSASSFKKLFSSPPFIPKQFAMFIISTSLEMRETTFVLVTVFIVMPRLFFFSLKR